MNFKGKTFRKLIRESGFSMLQGLLLSGVIAGAALVVTKQNETSNKLTRSSQTDLAINEMSQQIQTNLLNMRACTNSFVSRVVTNGERILINQLRNESNVPLFIVGSNYLNNQVLIDSMFLSRSGNQGNLEVIFRKVGNKDERGLGNRTIRREYSLNVTWSSANAVIDCYSGLNNSIETAVTRAIEELCGTGNTFENGLFKRGEGCDAIPQIQPSTPTQNYAPIETELTCDNEEGFLGLEFNPSTQKYEKRCLRIYNFQGASCNPDQLLRRRSNGDFDCVSPICPAGQIFKGLKADGTADCLGCPNGSLLIRKNSPGRWECLNVVCAADEYLVGVENGTPRCNKLVANTNNYCQGQGRLIAVGGSLRLDCCNPDCSGASNRCEGEPFPSNNSCGICTGTKVGTCANASQYCVGTTFLDSAGCKMCQGTKPSMNATWSWTDTGETREISGCVNGVIKTEKKQKKICDNNQVCGGVGCSEPLEQWVAGTNKSCAPVGKCQGWGSDTSGLFVQGAPDTGSCQSGYRYQYFDIVTSQFKKGNIYSLTQGQTFSEEVRDGDTPQALLQRLATKMNNANVVSTGACGTSAVNITVISSNRIQYRVQWQHSTLPSASRSCNALSESVCTSTPGCNWNTTSANVCTGWNYTVPQGTCNGTYYQEGCAWNGMDMGFGGSSGSKEECMYSYRDASSCNAAWAKGCYWGSVQQTCYASSQSQCSALGSGCSWKSYPALHRSCTAASYESQCTGEGAGVCTWGPR